MPSPKQFRGLITTSELTVKTVKHAGIQMHLQLTVLEYCTQVHCDTHHCRPDIHPPSCLIYSELLNRCLFGINASEIKLQNNEMAVCRLVMHTEDYRVHLDPFTSTQAFQYEHMGPVWSLWVIALNQMIPVIFHISILHAVVQLLQYASVILCTTLLLHNVYFHWKFEGSPATYAGGYTDWRLLTVSSTISRLLWGLTLKSDLLNCSGAE